MDLPSFLALGIFGNLRWSEEWVQRAGDGSRGMVYRKIKVKPFGRQALAFWPNPNHTLHPQTHWDVCSHAIHALASSAPCCNSHAHKLSALMYSLIPVRSYLVAALILVTSCNSCSLCGLCVSYFFHFYLCIIGSCQKFHDVQHNRTLISLLFNRLYHEFPKKTGFPFYNYFSPKLPLTYGIHTNFTFFKSKFGPNVLPAYY